MHVGAHLDAVAADIVLPLERRTGLEVTHEPGSDLQLHL